MDTIAIKTAAAAVTGARHVRSSRNGQDAAAVWRGAVSNQMQLSGTSSRPSAQPPPTHEVAVVVVSDGCSSGASSEVGARLGAALFARALGTRLQADSRARAVERASCPATWAGARADVVRALAELLERMPGDRTEIIREHFLFTIIAAAVTPEGAAVWALGDGAYSLGDHTRVLGPFENNAPPYLAYDLLGESGPGAAPAHFEIASPSCGAIVIATDGATELDGGLEKFAAHKFVDHPDALRRHLAVLAKANERIDWDERRVVRTPAALQDDCAVGVLRWSVA